MTDEEKTCPQFICDGSGILYGRGDENDRPCPCQDTQDHDPELADNAN